MPLWCPRSIIQQNELRWSQFAVNEKAMMYGSDGLFSSSLLSLCKWTVAQLNEANPARQWIPVLSYMLWGTQDKKKQKPNFDLVVSVTALKALEQDGLLIFSLLQRPWGRHQISSFSVLEKSSKYKLFTIYRSYLKRIIEFVCRYYTFNSLHPGRTFWVRWGLSLKRWRNGLELKCCLPMRNYSTSCSVVH